MLGIMAMCVALSADQEVTPSLVFSLVEEARGVTEGTRAAIEERKSRAPFEAGRCLYLLDRIEEMIPKIETETFALGDAPLSEEVKDDFHELTRLYRDFAKSVKELQRVAG